MAGSSEAERCQCGKRSSQGSTLNCASRSSRSFTEGSRWYWRPIVTSLPLKKSCKSSAVTAPPAAVAILAFKSWMLSLPSRATLIVRYS